MSSLVREVLLSPYGVAADICGLLSALSGLGDVAWRGRGREVYGSEYPFVSVFGWSSDKLAVSGIDWTRGVQMADAEVDCTTVCWGVEVPVDIESTGFNVI